ncbi:NAD(P)-dependent oxidoreductase [Streptomyces physcomitrii]|uniref:NAD(P)-dependent oxidoreductase n=1 Tax=Streptomyces physcomitrii TaxID=2724184 RepID=UPI0034391EB2
MRLPPGRPPVGPAPRRLIGLLHRGSISAYGTGGPGPSAASDLRRIAAGTSGGYTQQTNALRAHNAPDIPQTEYQALPGADVLSLHAPSLPESHHLIDAAELAALPPGAVLVDTARGALVDTAALTELERYVAGLPPLAPMTPGAFAVQA